MTEPNPDFDAGDVRLEDPAADELMVSTPDIWRYLPKLLYYPVRGYALPIVVVIGAIVWILGYAGLFGIAASSIVFGWMGYYSMGVVLRTSQGHAIPPPLGTEVLFEGEKLRLAVLFLYIATVLLLSYGAALPGRHWESVLVFVVGVYLLPAFLGSLALQPDLLTAMNPLVTLRFVWHTGLAYLFACLMLAGIGFLGVFLSGHVAGIVSSMLLVYGLLFVCHLVGYIAYHHQDEIELAVAVQKPTDETRAVAAQAQRLAALLAVVDKKLEAKDAPGARDAILKEAGAGVVNPRGFHEDLFEALRLRHQDALSLVAGNRLIRYLVEQKRASRALDIGEQCLDISKDFLTDPPGLMVALAEEALRDKRMPVFARLDAQVQGKLPASMEAVSLQFLKARSLAEQRQDAAALALVAPLVSWTKHPWHARIAALHNALSGIQRKT